MFNLDFDKFEKSNLKTKKEMLTDFYKKLFVDELKITSEEEQKNSKTMYFHLVNCAVQLVRDDMSLADISSSIRSVIIENKVGVFAHYSDNLFSNLDYQIHDSGMKSKNDKDLNFYPDIDYKKTVYDFSRENPYEKKENIEFYAWLGTYGRGYLGLERNHGENLESLKNRFVQSPDFLKIGGIYETFKSDLIKYQSDVYNNFLNKMNREHPNNKGENDFPAFVLTYHYDKLSLHNPSYMRPDSLMKKIPNNNFSELHKLYGQFKQNQGINLTNKTIKF